MTPSNSPSTDHGTEFRVDLPPPSTLMATFRRFNKPKSRNVCDSAGALDNALVQFTFKPSIDKVTSADLAVLFSLGLIQSMFSCREVDVKRNTAECKSQDTETLLSTILRNDDEAEAGACC